MEADRPTLHVLTCGSVDDGKSTLIGRLLYDEHLILDDQLAALTKVSPAKGAADEVIDFASLVDGLEAERKQGITIDVAYRYFSTPRRSFIVADTPGHEQYTRNMVTGASSADAAILLVDARRGLLTQTHRHAAIVSLMLIRHVVLAVNKMDLVGYEKPTFDHIVEEFQQSTRSLNFETVIAVPISARTGDNVSVHSELMPWYTGPTLLSALETIETQDGGEGGTQGKFCLPVQWVNRPHLNYRGFAGTIASGEVHVGDTVAVAPAGTQSRISSILVAGREAAKARSGDAVTVTLTDEVDVARGDVLCRPDARPEIGEQFAAHLIWMGEDRLHVGRSYIMKCGPLAVPATIIELRHRVDVATQEQLAAKTLEMNEIGACKIAASRRIAFETYADNRAMGGFVLIDRESNATVAAGVIDYHLRRSENVHFQKVTVTKEARAAQKHQTPLVLWFTGLSGAGKSTIADLVEMRLHARGVHTMLLDGDNVRHGLSRDLGFTEDARIENIRRVGEVAKLMREAGLITLCSFISPFAADRQMVREMLAPGEFIEIFVDASLDVAIQRDPKGLYRRALAGEIKNFTGVDQPYEPPIAPELRLETTRETAEALAERVVSYLEGAGAISQNSL